MDREPPASVSPAVSPRICRRPRTAGAHPADSPLEPWFQETHGAMGRGAPPVRAVRAVRAVHPRALRPGGARDDGCAGGGGPLLSSRHTRVGARALSPRARDRHSRQLRSAAPRRAHYWRVLTSVARLLESWGNTMRDAVRNTDRCKGRRAPTQDPSTPSPSPVAIPARCGGRWATWPRLASSTTTSCAR